MRSKFDSLDFVQMVWASFFRNPHDICSFEQPEDLVKYLAALARHKVIEEYRRRIRTKKYNITRERSLGDSDLAQQSAEAAQPTPSQIAIAREQWEKLMQDQPERDRSIVQMRIGGATFVEIGRQLGIHERTARKVIDRLVRS
jgi:RNA polymerase sigma-70 factor (ECF subfamily)